MNVKLENTIFEANTPRFPFLWLSLSTFLAHNFDKWAKITW